MASLSVSWRTASVAHLSLRRSAAAPDLGLPWPAANRLSEIAGLILANIGPDAVLAIHAERDAKWFEGLCACIGDKAAITDQSGSYRILRLQEAGARDVLSSGIFIDLAPEEFPTGAAAAVRCGHIAVILLHRTSGAFEILVPRSYAGSFLHWLKASAAMRNLRLEEHQAIDSPQLAGR